MILKYVTKNGMRIHEPPYTKAEEDEFYRRVGGGPVTVYRSSADRKATERDRPPLNYEAFWSESAAMTTWTKVPPATAQTLATSSSRLVGRRVRTLHSP